MQSEAVAVTDFHAHDHSLENEVTALREIVKVFEMEAAGNALTAAQFRQISDSRFYPLMLVIIRVATQAENIIRRLLGKAPVAGTGRRHQRRAPAAKESLDIVTDEDLSIPASPVHEQSASRVSRGADMVLHAIKVAIRGNRGRTSPRLEANPYYAWVDAYRRVTPDVRKHLARRIGLFENRPLLSVVMASYNTDHRFLAEAIDSVLDQVYTRFELIIADDCSPDPEVRAIVEGYAARDARVRLVTRDTNGGISAATNDAIAHANGEWLVFMDHDDTLEPHALFHVVLALQNRPDIALLYSDEDKINEFNEPFSPYFKSDFDPLLLLGQNYVCHLTTVRRDIVDRLGGLRTAFDGAQDWDLVLRVAEIVDRRSIVHIPQVLYHWRSHSGSTSLSSQAKPWALDAGRRAVSDALARRQWAGEVHKVGTTGFAQVHFALPDTPPKVSILIPTRDGRYLGDCLYSVLEKTTYPHFEVVVIDNGSVKPLTTALFNTLGSRIRVVRDDSPFNYSALHNRAVPHCSGEVLVLLNDDTEVTDGEWLSHMVAQLLVPGVGAVGAKLLYPDGRIQHAGIILGPNGLAAHVGQFHAGTDVGYFGRTALASEFQAVTAACLAVRREDWEAVGGLDEEFQVAFNDLDFCLRLQQIGRRVTYSPLVTLTHYESVSRGLDEHGEKFRRFVGEIQLMRQHWGYEIARDPYYNPNLSYDHGIFHLAYPPRTSPWYTGIE